MGSRKQVEKEIIKMIGDWLPGTGNAELYKEKFKGMSDKQFDDMMVRFRDGTDTLRAVVPNYKKSPITLKHNFKIAKQLGHSFLERCWFTSEESGVEYLSTHEYLIVQLPLRRQSQLLFKKLRVPETNSKADALTGQATGTSRASAITAPETQIMMSLGLENTITETMKVRGGDRAAMSALDRSVIETGTGSISRSAEAGDGVKVNSTLSMYLTSMHVSNRVKG